MAVGIDKIEVRDPDTAEIHEYRSPLYYAWLYPIQRGLGVVEPPARNAKPPEPFYLQQPGQSPPTAPSAVLPPAPPVIQPPAAPSAVLPPALPTVPSAIQPPAPPATQLPPPVVSVQPTQPEGPSSAPVILKRAEIELSVVYEKPGASAAEQRVDGTNETIYLPPKPDLTNADISGAEMRVDPLTGRPAVTAHLTAEGTGKLSALTARNVGRRLAIIVDGKILATPVIMRQIRNGRISIEGFKTVADAQRVTDSLARK